MCSRLNTKQKQALTRHLKVEEDHTQTQDGVELAKFTEDARPTDALAVVASDHPHALVPMRWGLIPSWTRMEMGRWPAWIQSTFNARSEEVADKPAFRAAFQRKRCLVPCVGFYEWSGSAKTRQKHELHLQNGEPMVLAGLWDEWEGPEGYLRSFTILTCAPNAFMARIHDRMPVILAPSQYEQWLKGNVGDAQALLKPCPDSWMQDRIEGGAQAALF